MQRRRREAHYKQCANFVFLWQFTSKYNAASDIRLIVLHGER